MEKEKKNGYFFLRFGSTFCIFVELGWVAAKENFDLLNLFQILYILIKYIFLFI